MSLTSALSSATGALDVLGQAIGVIQNNVANASTPGYVTQTLNFKASSFDAQGNVWGGVQSAGIQSSRDVYAERAVWTANQQAGQSTQEASSLNSLQSLFDVSGSSGVPSSLSSLYSAFSAWSSNPTDTTSRQQVLSSATALAKSFNQTASDVTTLRSQTDQQITSTVSQVNALSQQIAALNGQIADGAGQDAGVQTQLYNSVEQLSNLAPITTLTQSNGTVTVLLGGQSPLVEGTEQHALSVGATTPASPTYPGAAPDTQILTDAGQDVTSDVDQGQLGGLLTFRNQTIPSVIGDSNQVGSLNQLAQTVADRVNTLLTQGQVSTGPPSVSGSPLFSYSPASQTSVAATLSLDAGISASTLAAISPAGSTLAANGTAASLANLSDSENAIDQVNGQNYTAFYGTIASGIGQQQSAAAANQQSQSQLLSQAQNLRAQSSGVSLNQQASLLMEYQQSYQAAAQLISVVNSTTQSLLTVMQQIQ